MAALWCPPQRWGFHMLAGAVVFFWCRVAYRSMDRSLTDEEINDLQERVRASLTEDLKVELR